LSAALYAVIVSLAYVNHDAAWYLHMAAVWLDGGTLYRDVIDTNPPLIILLTVPPVWLGRLLHVADTAVFKSYVMALAGVSGAISLYFIRSIWDEEAWSALLATVIVFLVVPFSGADFGQREHFAVLLVLPYVLAACAAAVARPPGRVTGLAIGGVAGLGFALKPHFLSAWLAIELCLLMLRARPPGWLRSATLGVCASLLVYAAILVLFVPQYFSIANQVRQVYGGLNSTSTVLLDLVDLQLWAVAAIALVLIRLPAQQRNPCLVLFAGGSGFLLSAVLQWKGWSYHLYPSRVFTLLFFSTLIVAIADSHPAVLDLLRGRRRSLNATVLALVIIATTRYGLESLSSDSRDLVTRLIAAVRQQAPKGPLAVLSVRTIVYPAFPVVNYTRAEWSLRYNSLWFLPGLYAEELPRSAGAVPFRTGDTMSQSERDYFEQIILDLCAKPPQLLMIERTTYRAPPYRLALDLVGYYRQDPRFDRLFAAYAPTDRVGPFDLYSPTTRASCAEEYTR
jgi:hypothetical protein